MPVREGIYGLLAEFNTPGELVQAAEGGARGRLPAHGVLHALPGGGGRGGDGLPREERAAGVPDGRAAGNGWRCSDGDLDCGVGVSAEHRGPAAVSRGRRSSFRRTSGRFCWRGLSAAFGMLALNGLPKLYHPLFNAPNFRTGATTDKFFLCLEATDPKFEIMETRGFLEAVLAGVGGGGGVLIPQGTGCRVQGVAFSARRSAFAVRGLWGLPA